MDILAALEAAKSVPPGLTLEAHATRTGSTAIRMIDGVGGGLGVSWRAWVNTRFVGESVQPAQIGSEDEQKPKDPGTLKPGDTVLLKLSTKP